MKSVVVCDDSLGQGVAFADSRDFRSPILVIFRLFRQMALFLLCGANDMKTRSLTLRTTAVLATSMLLTGCGISTSYTPLNAPPHKLHARTPAQVEVFEGKEPERAHIEVGAIDVRQQASNHARKEELFARMRDMGAQHGCDAVKIVGRTDYRNRVGYRAACIVYDEPRPQVPATPMEISRSNPYPDIAEPVVAKPTP